MKQVRKILFPIDFAEKYEVYIPWIKTFVEKFDATLYLLFVTQDLSGFMSFYVPHGNVKAFHEEALAAAQKKMGDAVQEHFKGFTKLETRVATGKPAEKILEAAKKEGIDLIVMGTHGRKGVDYTIFGSVCREVVRAAHCPVLTLHPEKA